VPKDVRHERGLARSTLSYKDANLVIRHAGWVELPELKRHLQFSRKIRVGLGRIKTKCEALVILGAPFGRK